MGLDDGGRHTDGMALVHLVVEGLGTSQNQYLNHCNTRKRRVEVRNVLLHVICEQKEKSWHVVVAPC